jgi:magnesium-transporting ATPase (P-type)
MGIIKPFKIIGQIFPVFIIFLISNFVIGQIGILASIGLGASETSMTMKELFVINLNAGNLYTFSIALIATSINQYFIDFLIEDEVLFKKYKILLTAISVVIIVFMAIFYSAHQLHSLEENIKSTIEIKPTKLVIDKLQLIFYVTSIVISTYMFCVNFLKLDPDSYIELDDQNILKLKKSSKTVKKDSQGTSV